jgi:hypothetical protein
MIGHRRAWLLVATLSAAPACTHHDKPLAQEEVELGTQGVLLSVPEGWDLLDQGKQKRFRYGEISIVLENLGKTDVDPALASLQDTERREVKSRRQMTIDSHDAVDIETWSRLDHTWPERLLFVRAEEDLLALHTTGRADPSTLIAFDAIRDSLHFAATERR